MSEKQQQNQSQEYIWMRRQDPSVVLYWEDLEEKQDLILEQDFHVDL
jgi:acetyl-CoA carboxylase beta subunit